MDRGVCVGAGVGTGDEENRGITSIFTGIAVGFTDTSCSGVLAGSSADERCGAPPVRARIATTSRVDTPVETREIVAVTRVAPISALRSSIALLIGTLWTTSGEDGARGVDWLPGANEYTPAPSNAPTRTNPIERVPSVVVMCVCGLQPSMTLVHLAQEG